MNVSRRKIIAGTVLSVVSLLAGCGDILLMNDPEMTVFNATDNELTADISLVNSSGEKLVSTSATISPDTSFTRDNILPSSGTLTLSITVENGPTDSREFDTYEETEISTFIYDNHIEFKGVSGPNETEVG